MGHVLTQGAYRRFPRQFGLSFPNFPQNFQGFPGGFQGRFPQQYQAQLNLYPQSQFMYPGQSQPNAVQQQQDFNFGQPQQYIPQNTEETQTTQQPQVTNSQAQIERCNVQTTSCQH